MRCSNQELIMGVVLLSGRNIWMDFCFGNTVGGEKDRFHKFMKALVCRFRPWYGLRTKKTTRMGFGR